MFHFDYDAGRCVFERLTCKLRVSKLFPARFKTTTKGTGTFVVVLPQWLSRGPKTSRSVTVRTRFPVYLLQIETFKSPLRENLNL